MRRKGAAMIYTKQKIRLILVVSIILLSTLFVSGSALTEANPRERHEARIALLIEEAIEKVEEYYPEFDIDPDTVYVTYDSEGEDWYAYVFSESDRALSITVSYRSGEYNVNFSRPYNSTFYEVRQLLINKMNELMPYNTEFNGFLSLSPDTFDPEISYAVVISDREIDIDAQLEIDYEIWQYANELFIEYDLYSSYTYIEDNQNLCDFKIAYYSYPLSDFHSIAIERWIRFKFDFRDRSISSFVYFESPSASGIYVTPEFKYNSHISRNYFDADLENLLSFDKFVEQAYTVNNYFELRYMEEGF